MKFEIAIFILKVMFYITFPMIMLSVGFIATINLNLIIRALGLLFMLFGLSIPVLARDLIFKYTDQIIKKGKECDC